MGAVVHQFEQGAGLGGRRAALERVAAAPVLSGVGRIGAMRPNADGFPLPGPLAPLAPGGLKRGGVTGLDEDRYLAAAVLGAAAARAGAVALLGIADAGVEAVAAAGAPLERMVIIDPGRTDWIRALDLLIGHVDVVALALPAPVPEPVASRVVARLRRGEARTALLACGRWPGASLRLAVEDASWSGLGAGSGQLLERRARVSVTTQARSRSVEMLLPGRTGAPAPLATTRSSTARGRGHLRVA